MTDRAKPAAAHLLQPDLDAVNDITIKTQGQGGGGG